MNNEQISRQDSIFRITDIEYTNSQVDDKIIGIFRFEPSGANKKGSTAIVLAEIDGVGYVYDQLIDVVNNETEHSRTLLSNIEQESVTRFEKIIQNVNRAVQEFLASETAPINWSRVNIFIMELSEQHICLAGIGRLMNMFLQRQPDGTFKTYDLFGSLDQRMDIDPAKAFSNIICGDIKPGDVLLAGSKNFERLRNEFRIKERLTTLPPVTAAHEIKQDLERRNIPDDFVATVITCRQPEKPNLGIATEPEKEKSTTSIEKLRQTEAETLRHLAPSITRKDAKTNLGEPNAPRVDGFRVITYITDIIRRRFKKQQLTDVASMVHLRGMNAGFGSFLSKQRKRLIFGAIALAIVCVVIGMVAKHQKAISVERAAWNASYDSVKADIEKAEGQAVYSEDQARRTLSTALAQMEDLDTETPERKEAIDNLTTQAEGVKKKLQRLVNVENPTAIYSATEGLADGALLSPILFQEKIVLVNRANEKLIVINPENREAKEITLPEGSEGITGIAAGKTSVIVHVGSKKLISVNIDTGASSSLSFDASQEKNITDITTYGSKLYILDAESQQIWRHQSVSGGFGTGAKYLQASATDLSNAVSLAIDANIYVLNSDGSVARFFNGGQDGFSISPIDPELKNGNSIWADADSETVAIADAQGKRIITFTKEGQLIGQYVSPVFKGPTDILGDAKAKKLYAIDNNILYEFPLP